jgi:hypothetical protein
MEAKQTVPKGKPVVCVLGPHASYATRSAAAITKSRARVAAKGVLGLMAASAQHQTVEQRRIPTPADVMSFELLARSACFTAQQRVAANDGTEFSARTHLVER